MAKATPRGPDSDRLAGLYLGVMILSEALAERDAPLAGSIDRLQAAALMHLSQRDRASYLGQTLVKMQEALAVGRASAGHT